MTPHRITASRIPRPRLGRIATGRVRAGWLSVLVLALAWSARAAEPSTDDACLWRARSAQTSVQTVVFRAYDRVGAVTESRATIHWKRFDSGLSSLLMRFAAPRTCAAPACC